MYEDGPIADGDAAKDSDRNPLGFNGFRLGQPSNKLNHPNDKHTTGLNADCIRQFGIEAEFSTDLGLWNWMEHLACGFGIFHRNFSQKSKFWSKIETLVKIMVKNRT